jgi:hypothetical protein
METCGRHGLAARAVKMVSGLAKLYQWYRIEGGIGPVALTSGKDIGASAPSIPTSSAVCFLN